MLSISKSIFLGLLCLFPTLLLAQVVADVVVSQRNGITDILKAAEIVQSQEPDPAKAATLSFSKFNDETFKDFNGWLRFNVSNQDVKDSIFVIQDRANNNPIFSLYQKSVDGDLWLPVSNNGHVRFPVNVFGRAVVVPKGTSRQFLLRFARNPYEKVTYLAVIPFHLQYDGGKNHISIFLAIALTMIALYHFAIYLLSKVRIYLIHALYSILFVVFMVTTNPWLYYWVSSLFSIKLLFDINLISSVLVLGAYGEFVYVFLDAKTRFPQLRKWHSGFLILTILSTLLIIYIQVQYNAFFISRDITVGLCLILFVTITAFLFIAFRKNVRADYFLLIGSLVLWSSILFGIYILYKAFYTDIFLIIACGTIFEILIFALGIGYKLQLETRARIVQQVKFNEELEEQVLQRTRQIQEQKEEIVTQNEELISQREEIAAQNEELIQGQEEIAAQRDQMAYQNVKLKEAQTIIEEQNQKILSRNANLEEEVRKRTRELTDYNLQLEQFAFIASHNLRAPVARILGLSHLLALQQVNLTEKELITQKMIFSCAELDTIVKDLGQILEIRENLNQTITEVNLQKELAITLNGLENDILQSKAVIDINFEMVDTVHTIRPYLQSILLNLLSNAIKYRHPDRPPHIQISSAIVDNKVEIDFRDNGLGIDLPQYGEKLFKLYSRFHFHVEGKGKGLFLVKTHVDAMGGTLVVQSKVNEGTVFKIFLKN